MQKLYSILCFFDIFLFYFLLKNVKEFILEREPFCEPAAFSETDYSALADWYQELSLTWRRLRVFCQNNMPELAYIDAGYLQNELMYISQEFHIEEMNLLDSFNANDLSSFQICADHLEQKVLTILSDHQTPVNSYESVEAFLRTRA